VTAQSAADKFTNVSVDALTMLNGKSVESIAGFAQTNATLALAAETRALRESQDTANLIAWRNGLQVYGYLVDEKLDAVTAQINERLGL
jgi:surface antigen